jgi:hypothetical protein
MNVRYSYLSGDSVTQDYWNFLIMGRPTVCQEIDVLLKGENVVSASKSTVTWFNLRWSVIGSWVRLRVRVCLAVCFRQWLASLRTE